MKRLATVLLLLAAACGGSDSTAPPAPPKPVNVILTNVARTPLAGGGQDVIAMTITNTGGPGAYKIQFWSTPYTQVNGADHVANETDVVTVVTGYAETITWTVPLPAGWVPIGRVTAESRDENSAIFRETSSVYVR